MYVRINRAEIASNKNDFTYVFRNTKKLCHRFGVRPLKDAFFIQVKMSYSYEINMFVGETRDFKENKNSVDMDINFYPISISPKVRSFTRVIFSALIA